MIRHPSAQTSNGQIVNEIVSNLDIAPTILDLAGIPIPPSMQGASLLPFIHGEVPNNWRDKLFLSIIMMLSFQRQMFALTYL